MMAVAAAVATAIAIFSQIILATSFQISGLSDSTDYMPAAIFK